MSAIFWLWVSWVLFCLGLVMAGASAYAGDVDVLKRSEMTGDKPRIEEVDEKVDEIKRSLLYLRVPTSSTSDRDVAAANRIADIIEKQWREIREIHKR